MQGLELARKYYESFGDSMLKEQFPELLPLLAVGLIGSGSECFGYDDAVSTDHDFEPGFMIFLPDEDVVDRKTAFRLERAYAKLPREFGGFRRSLVQPVGGPRRGVIRIRDFLMEKLGQEDADLSLTGWLTLPDQSLAELTGGSLFFDNYGLLTQIRERLSFFPEDIRKKKMAGHLLLMAQAGQYNYERCIRHGEPAAAQIAVYEFVKSAISLIFLLNRRYQPYYKWGFRALRELPCLALEAELFEYLLTTDNEPGIMEEKAKVIEGIAADVILELRGRHLSNADCGDLEKHAWSVNDSIGNGVLRNMHILAAV